MPHPVEKRIALDGVAYTFEKYYDSYGANYLSVERMPQHIAKLREDVARAPQC